MFKQYKKDNETGIIHENHLARKEAMSPWNMESIAKECEAFGLAGTVKKDGVEPWQDFCVVEGRLTLPCDWLLKKGEYVYHVNDKEEIAAENS